MPLRPALSPPWPLLSLLLASLSVTSPLSVDAVEAHPSSSLWRCRCRGFPPLPPRLAVLLLLLGLSTFGVSPSVRVTVKCGHCSDRTWDVSSPLLASSITSSTYSTLDPPTFNPLGLPIEILLIGLIMLWALLPLVMLSLLGGALLCLGPLVRPMDAPLPLVARDGGAGTSKANSGTPSSSTAS